MATLRQTFSDIASAIRAKGITGTMKPIEMATKIGEIQQGFDYSYLKLTAEENTTLTLNQNGGIEPHKLLKSTDGVNWTKWENPSTNGISLNVGESVYLKADEDALWRTATEANYYNYFSSTGKINCSGDIMSIVNLSNSNYDYFLGFLFKGNVNLTNAPELKTTTSINRCYSNMFDGCTSLIKPPSVVYVNSSDAGCNGMFYNCNKMTYAPELPATTLDNGCYQWMFGACSSLTQAPELPATTLYPWCYYSMFNNCTSLTTAPELPATTLANSCYYYMFDGCTSLTTAPELPSTTLAQSCYSYMFNNCTSLTTAPVLPATTLDTNCYSYMFNGCTSLKRIKMNASSGSIGENMFNGCTSLELVDMTGSTGVPTLSNVNNFANTNDTYKIVVPDSLYDTWIASTNWSSISSHIMKQSDWNAAHPDDILG